MQSNYHFSFEDLIVYQKTMELAEIVNQLILKFPKKIMTKFKYSPLTTNHSPQ